MNFRLIALASCVALGSIAFGGKAQAQATLITPVSVTLTSSGVIVPSCSISTSPTAGIMAPGPSGKTLTTTIGFGVPARFGLTCNSAASVVVEPSTSTGQTLSATATLDARLSDGAVLGTGTLSASSVPATTSNPPQFVNRTFSLDYVLTDTTDLAPGTYGFTTVVNITPE